MASDVVDRKYVSRYSQPTFGITVYQAGVLADADADPTVDFVVEGDTAPTWSRTATHDSVGSYSILLSSADTSTPELATLMWDYAIGGVAQVYGLDIQVGPSSPDYDALPPDWRVIIEAVWVKFADLFDSPYGGPNLQVYVQTHFGRNRLAQLLPAALQRLNSASTPHKSFVMGGTDFPFSDWGGLLAQSLYIEVIKHLIRSYTEQPEAVLATNVSRMDRRDYMDRWQAILSMEQAEFERDLSRYRQSWMGLGSVSVLVDGGAYGHWGPQVDAAGSGQAAARGYYYAGRYH